MLVVLAGRSDAQAIALVRRWRQHDARLLTCEALGRRGWSFDPAAPGAGSFVVGDAIVPVSRVDGVVSLLPAAVPPELGSTAAQDRPYVAGEMMAFLVAWLSALPCRVLNRPTPTSLLGPQLHQAQWVRAAAAAGLAVRPWSRRVVVGGEIDAPARPSLREIAVVAGRVVPTPAAECLDQALLRGLARLATDVGAGLMTAGLSDEDELVSAISTVDTMADGVADAMLRALVGAP